MIKIFNPRHKWTVKNVLSICSLFIFGTVMASTPKIDIEAQETFLVTLVAPENGTYTVSPELPADGKVVAGTELTVTATPSEGYSLDVVYYTFKGGMWGTTSIENFTPTMKIVVDKDMSVGATFVENNLVENLNVTHDVVYAKPGVKPLKYDVFAPKGAKDLPAVVIIHGGGWSSNNEDVMRGLARELTKGNQYVVFSMDYRWVNNLDGDATPNYMHNLIEDVFGGIAHIQEHAKEYGADPTKIAVTGDSAGGHLSAAAALLSPMIGDGGFGTSEGVFEYMPTYMPKGKSVDEVKKEIVDAVQVAAPSYGPFNASDFKQFIQQTDQGYLDAVSPSEHVPNVADRAIPHFIVRGTEDPIIPDAMIQGYVNLLKEKGQTVEYLQVEGAGHAFFDWKPDAQTRATFAKYGVPYAAEMKSFFDSVFY
ncbi:alpha/beta fold hydrolase [Flagellimonas aequoris]|nr:alpha/beta fold hydrolase [Allomuricauda aequoris]